MERSTTRTLAKRGRWIWEQWPEHLTVEYDRLEPQESETTAYAVYVNGEYVGRVSSLKTESSVPTGPGNRLRRVLGYPTRWEWDQRPAGGRHYESPQYDTRAGATSELVRITRRLVEDK